MSVRTPSLLRYRPLRWLAVLMFSPLLLSCDGQFGSGLFVDDTGSGAVTIDKPAFLAQFRAIDASELSVAVSVNGNDVSLRREDSGRYVGEAQIPMMGVSTISVLWVGPNQLPLAQVTDKEITNNSVVIFDGDYDKSFDQDNDGRTNIAELDAGTDPFDPQDPAEPVVRVPLALRIELPQQLVNADTAIVSSVVVEAFVNELSASGGPVILNKDGNVWTGETTVPQNSEVGSRVTFYPAGGQYRLAELRLNQDIGAQGGSLQFRAAEYETGFDADSDGLSNIEELAQGSNPADSSDPPRDPCDVDPNATGCSNTTDTPSDDSGDESGTGGSTTPDDNNVPPAPGGSTTDTPDDTSTPGGSTTDDTEDTPTPGGSTTDDSADTPSTGDTGADNDDDPPATVDDTDPDEADDTPAPGDTIPDDTDSPSGSDDEADDPVEVPVTEGDDVEDVSVPPAGDDGADDAEDLPEPDGDAVDVPAPAEDPAPADDD